MKLSIAALYVATMFGGSTMVEGQGEMVKMCLFYENPSGHARSDPIIDQQCASGHVHTFYGPQNFHPNTSYEDIRDTPAQFSSTPFVENQSLYWHPTIYEVSNNGDGTKTYTRAPDIFTSPYYRWDNSVNPQTEAFPPGFRMIAHSNDLGANNGGETGGNMLTECCDMQGEEEDCQEWDSLVFPTRTCDFLGIAFAMPTCWNGDLGINNDHKSHMAYTTNGEVAGPCPAGFNRRLPQVQLFVRVNNYKGGTYQLSDGSDVFHVDFMNGWQEGKLQQIIDGCEPFEQGVDEYNPPCGCTEIEDGFLTPNPAPAAAVCDVDVRELIIDEATDVTNTLPAVSCQGPPLIPKSWTELTTDLLDCAETPGGPNTPAPVPITPAPVQGTPAPVSVTPAPVPVTPAPVPITPPPVTTPAPVPTPAVACEDKFLAFKDEDDKNCNWVASKPHKRCDKVWDDRELWEYCPVACDVDCVDCCEVNYYDCLEEMDAVCGPAFDECEAVCVEEDLDVDACIDEDCHVAEDECFEAEEGKCWDAAQACESICD